MASTAVDSRPPTEEPPFTIADLKKAIPAHCFERSTLRSSMYTVIDLAMVAAVYMIATTVIPASPAILQPILWPIYWVIQGGVATGLWVIAHECGHRAYSDSVLVCDIVGFILHSALLVPYHSWRISHAKHHRATGDADRDEVFVPKRASQMIPPNTATSDEDTTPSGWTLYPFQEPPAWMLSLEAVIMFLLGWPAYLFFNVGGRDYGTRANHFEPKSPIFRPNQSHLIFLSNIGLLTVLAIVGAFSYYYTFTWVMCVYGGPVLVVNFWLVLYTYLHHTDKKLPHYTPESWNWLKGALCTVDRDYGFIWNTLHHDIGNTHVLHHLFSKIPHYHSREATEAIKPILKDYYCKSNESIFTALCNSLAKCRFVDDLSVTSGAVWYTDRLPSSTRAK